jgi:uncharacterized Ntn-hydrolase superfamily protein
MTFSIVAYDPTDQAWGVAVASKFLAVGAVVSWAQAGVGAVATQAFANVTYGLDGLKLMSEGLSAEEALARLLSKDENAEDRQAGFVDAQGNAAAHTGSECFDYAGHIIDSDHHFTVQGNILAGRVVLERMAEAYRAAKNAGNKNTELADWLTAALLAGEMAGGDKRGKQSAAVLVVKPNGGYGGNNDRYLDLRVDDHDDPIPRLQELLRLHHLYFKETPVENRLPVTEALASEVQKLLINAGHYNGALTAAWDEATRTAFWDLLGVENLEERWSPDEHADLLDPVLLDYLRDKYK